MKKLFLLLLLALMAIPTFAQTTSAPTTTHRAPLRDPFARPAPGSLKHMTFTSPGVEIGPDGKLAETAQETAQVSQAQAVAVPASETAVENHALMVEPDSSASDNVMWVLGGIAALGLIGALAYIILGMGSPDNTVYNA